MNKFLMIIIIFLMNVSFINAHYELLPDEEDIESLRLEKLKSMRYDEFFIWLGSDNYNTKDILKFDINCIDENDKIRFLEIGLKTLENVGEDNMFYCHILSDYYYHKKTFKKSLYWAFKGAELGSGECMKILNVSYAFGHGIINDVAESIKWLYLSSAAGNEEAIKHVDQMEKTSYKLEKDHFGIQYWLEGKRRANEWMLAHEHLFISKE